MKTMILMAMMSAIMNTGNVEAAVVNTATTIGSVTTIGAVKNVQNAPNVGFDSCYEEELEFNSLKNRF